MRGVRKGAARKRQRVESIDRVVQAVRAQSNVIEGFGGSVEAILTKNPTLIPVIHSFKKRRKSDESLSDKIAEKRKSGVNVDSVTVFKVITDLYAVRLIHLYPQDIALVHKAICFHAEKKDWILAEKPKAYTWDPESKLFLENLGLKCQLKPSYYTSVHYLVKPRVGALAVCEIQVRSLLEEVWGEADHKAKYKNSATTERVNEHLAVLARLIGAGSRLLSALHQSADLDRP